MTHQNTHQLKIRRSNPALIGFEELFKMLDMPTSKSKQEFPPHNLVKTSEDSYILTLAVVGRNKSDIKIELDNNVLTVSADALETDSSLEVIEHGIAFRAFKKDFNIRENVVVVDAKLKNGLLNIYLKNIIPENERKQTININ